MRIEASARLPVAPPRAWELLVDWERQREWMPATTVRVEPGPDQGVGVRLIAATGIGPLRVVDTMRVSQWEPPTRCVVDHTGRVLRGAGIFLIEPAEPGRSTITWTEDLALPRPVDRTLGGIGALAGRPFLTMALTRFARLLATD